MTEPQDLTEFKEQLWAAALKARRHHGWCPTFYTVMREEFGLSHEPENLAEPTEDGLYQVEGYTYFFIHFQGYWVHTALTQPREFTSLNTGDWDAMLAFMREKNILPRENAAFVKVG